MYAVLGQNPPTGANSASTIVSLPNASSASDTSQPSTTASVTIASPSEAAIDVSSASTLALPTSASPAHQGSVDAPLASNGAVASSTAPSQVATNVDAVASSAAPSQVATNIAAASHQASVGTPLLGNVQFAAVGAVVAPSPSPTNVSSSVGTLVLPSFAAATHQASVDAPLHGVGAYHVAASSSRQVASNVSSSVVLPPPSQVAASASSQFGTFVIPSFVAAGHQTGTDTSSTHEPVGHSAFTGVTFRSQAVVAGVGVSVDASPSLPAALSSLGSWCSRPGATVLLTQESSAITD